MSATHVFRGMRSTEHYFRLPLDHGHPEGETITVFAREISSTEHADPAALPWLLFLQGGPGGKSPRPASLTGWMAEAAKTYRILLLDQRGTGLSTPANRQSLPLRGDAAAQASYLTHFRADSIVRDAEAIRNALGISSWSTFGQSYGGFCTLTYLSLAPEALDRCIITGGLASLTADADTVYRATYARMAARNEEYFGWYPQDRDTLADIVAHLAHTEEHLPGGRELTVPMVQLLGQYLGGNTRVHALHYIFEGAFIETPGGKRLSDTFIAAVAEQADRATNPLYALLHESIYGQGAATNWSAERVLEEFPAFSPGAADPLLTGEMVYRWYFDSDQVLRPLEETARVLAEHEGWGQLYDLRALSANTVPVAAAVYTHDVYVDRDLSMATAAAVGNLRVWETDEFHHDGIGDEGAMIFAKLLQLGNTETGDGER
jgi:pimeloyl-ACP methyl ester carboxylesterase